MKKKREIKLITKPAQSIPSLEEELTTLYSEGWDILYSKFDGKRMLWAFVLMRTVSPPIEPEIPGKPRIPPLPMSRRYGL